MTKVSLYNLQKSSQMPKFYVAIDLPACLYQINFK